MGFEQAVVAGERPPHRQRLLGIDHGVVGDGEAVVEPSMGEHKTLTEPESSYLRACPCRRAKRQERLM